MAGTTSHHFFAVKGKQTYGYSLDDKTSLAVTVNGSSSGVTFVDNGGTVTITAPTFAGGEAVVISGTETNLIPAH